jgi:hypothetical protein
MTKWEYLMLALPRLDPPTQGRGESAAVRTLDELGEQGWEALNLVQLSDETVVVPLKRSKAE